MCILILVRVQPIHLIQMALISQISFPGVDLIATFYGCLYAGCVPITVRPPHPQNLATTLPTVKMIVEVGVRHSCPPAFGECWMVDTGWWIALPWSVWNKLKKKYSVCCGWVSNDFFRNLLKMVFYCHDLFSFVSCYFLHLLISLVISSACIGYDFEHALPGIINGLISLPSAGQ